MSPRNYAWEHKRKFYIKNYDKKLPQTGILSAAEINSDLILLSKFYTNNFTTHAHKLCLRTEKRIFIIRIFPEDFNTVYSLPKVACDLILFSEFYTKNFTTYA